MSAAVCTVVAKKTFKDCVRKPFSTFLAIIQEPVGRSENLEGKKYKNKVKTNLKIIIAYSHLLEISYYVNFLGCLGSNRFQLK